MATPEPLRSRLRHPQTFAGAAKFPATGPGVGNFKASPIVVGDTVFVQCHWNNTLENPFEQRALADQGLGEPVDVGLGEGSSTDEMCLEIFGIAVDAPPPPAARTAPDASLIPRDLLRTFR